ncbi:MAG TPA: FtsW/RodA/SpoVE family cell cycle protein, partial [Pyrinomonadaceae bacterium]|nr:FtsW/RodA/SpoVE family cell cycle protein [Pyrinomonadaceae bacterium]
MSGKAVNLQRMDWMLFAVAVGLAVFGSVMVYSASAMMALNETQNQSDLIYFYKQFGFTLFGIVAMVFVSRVDYHIFQDKRVVFGLLALTFVLVCSVYLFPAINGAHRWIRFAGFSFQPSEFAKITVPLFLAWFLTENESKVGDLKATVLPCLLVMALICGPIL